MNQKALGLAAVVLGIIFAAGLGVRSAASWLSRSTPSRANQDSVISIGPNNSSNGNRSELKTFEPETVEGDRASQSNRDNTTLLTQANGSTQSLSPIEEAGTYIQRQQRVEQDAVIANTPVTVIPTASSSTVAANNTTPPAAQSNTRVVTQPSPPTPVSTAPTPTAQPSAPAVNDPIPALW